VPPSVQDAFGMLWKSILFFVLLGALMRLMGKREIGSLSAMDLVVFIMLSETAAISIEDKRMPVWVGAVPVVALAALQTLTAYLSLKSHRVRAIVEGKPSVLVSRGRIQEQTMRSLRLNLNDLLSKLREKNVPNLADVEYAILEPSGELSVIPKAEARPVTPRDLDRKPPREGLPVALIEDGRIQRESLRMAGRDERWLREELRKQGIGDVEEVLLALVDAQGKLTVQRKEKGEA
jgi:uncharacterized membrane protein YcaP (DUF421 family)